ncbi:MAG: type II secretion system ATPase GspE [Deltaproteobacteria bacterium]|nr:type II secretion system ATPase GspE [Deltaproteobacteria bacterium]
MITMLLGEILVQRSGLSPDKLEEALALQKEKQERIGKILVSMKEVTEEDVAQALAEQFDLPYYHEFDLDIPSELVSGLPINFCKSHLLLPIDGKQDMGPVKIVCADPLDLAALDEVRLNLARTVELVISSPARILSAINHVYSNAEQITDGLEEGDLEDINDQGEVIEDLLDASDEAPIIRFVNNILFRSVKERASDIHFEPFEKNLLVRFRIDGVLYEVARPPKAAQASITSRIKIMAGMNIAEKRLPQDGRIRIKIAGKDIDIRVSTVPIAHGESIVMRLLDKSAVLLDLESLGFSKDQLEITDKLIHRSHGIILVTGPTGSGKTTTLYAALSRINKPEIKIITVEDPVEYQLPGIGQIQVNSKIGLTFANGLRSIVRQDPDVILVGEIRDLETAEIAIQASLTGHLVFSTVHTNDAPSTVTRLIDMGVEPFLVASSAIAIQAQRLVRRVCKYCKEPYVPETSELTELGIDPGNYDGRKFYRKKGCDRCMGTGYLGRTSIVELMPIDDEIRTMILKNTMSTEIKKTAKRRGMRTLREDGANKVFQGITTTEEVLRVTQEDSL